MTMWVFEEDVGGRKLTEIINTQHENVKYLPGHKLPPNVVSLNSPKEGRGEWRGCFLLGGGHVTCHLAFGSISEGYSRHRTSLCTAPNCSPGDFLGQENLNGSPAAPPHPMSSHAGQGGGEDEEDGLHGNQRQVLWLPDWGSG